MVLCLRGSEKDTHTLSQAERIAGGSRVMLKCPTRFPLRSLLWRGVSRVHKAAVTGHLSHHCVMATSGK